VSLVGGDPGVHMSHNRSVPSPGRNRMCPPRLHSSFILSAPHVLPPSSTTPDGGGHRRRPGRPPLPETSHFLPTLPAGSSLGLPRTQTLAPRALARAGGRAEDSSRDWLNA
jgi:hypothetical protein